jgi:hypothetical protein
MLFHQASPERVGLSTGLHKIFNLGYHPFSGAASPQRLSAKLVTKCLHKKLLNTIDNCNLIRYIYIRNKGVDMAWAFSLTRKEIKKKFKCSLEELQKRPDIRTTPSIDPDKTIVIVLP